ncbi:hypothetical protein G6052_08375 [Stenotrophomonas maltophilia]|nr:hypothetical protein G6052_08375 [Stenotrophomonas maltophilia]
MNTILPIGEQSLEVYPGKYVATMTLAAAKSVVICSLMPTAVPPMKGGWHGTPLPRYCKVARTAAARLTTAYVLV